MLYSQSGSIDMSLAVSAYKSKGEMRGRGRTNVKISIRKFEPRSREYVIVSFS